MQLNEALGNISDIRAQLAASETFRGFRSVTVGLSGMLALAAALLQSVRLPRPETAIREYVELWVTAAVLSLLVVGAELAHRCFLTGSPLKRRQTILAIQQFIPCLVAGACITWIIVWRHQASAWMLPGLWAVLFSLGVFTSCRSLPRQTIWVGVHYLAGGSCCLMVGEGIHALSPWMMAGTFGLGQLLTAAILYFCLERRAWPA